MHPTDRQPNSKQAFLLPCFPSATVEVIDYQMPKIEQTYDVSLKGYLAGSTAIVKCKRLLLLCKKPKTFKYLKRRKIVFERFVGVLPLSGKYIFSNDTKEVFEYINDKYDIVVVGSDAVWNYVSRGFPNAYFLGKEIRIPKLSYAASCYGMDYLCCENNRLKIKDCLSAFDFIGVRDEATENFVKWSGCEIPAVHTSDPTAFLNVDDLPIDEEKLKKKLISKGYDFSKPTIGIMGNDKMLKMVRSFYGKKYQIVSLYNYLPGADVQLCDITPMEWAYVFRYFKLVFTTFFHGTMLSLRNGTPLICIALETEFAKKHTPKTLDVLSRLGFEDWYFKTDFRDQNYDLIRKKADELIEAQPRAEILEKLDKEAESYNSFKLALENSINKLSI